MTHFGYIAENVPFFWVLVDSGFGRGKFEKRKKTNLIKTGN